MQAMHDSLLNEGPHFQSVLSHQPLQLCHHISMPQTILRPAKPSYIVPSIACAVCPAQAVIVSFELESH